MRALQLGMFTLLFSFATFADVGINVEGKKLTILNESGEPIPLVTVNLRVSYNECYRFYPGVGDPCSETSFIDKDYMTNSDGVVNIPAIKNKKNDSFLYKYENLIYSFNIKSITTSELQQDYSQCNYGNFKSHTTNKALSRNLDDYRIENGYSNSCAYSVENDTINELIEGEIKCEIAGMRDLGVINGSRTRINISLSDAISDFKQQCDL